MPGLHLLAAGERHGLALSRRLRQAGVAVLRRTVYRTTPVGALAEAVRDALLAGGLDVALFYSAETAQAFTRLAPPGTGALAALALSPAVARRSAACLGAIFVSQWRRPKRIYWRCYKMNRA